MSQPGKVCVYCGEPVLSGLERPEHAIPAALGATLTVDTVCDPCNSWAGKEIDQPFLADDWVREHRSQSGVIDPRRGRKGRPVASPMLSGGETHDGDFVSLDESGKPKLRSRIVDLGNNEFQIRANSMAEMERLKQRVEKRTGKQITDESIERFTSQPRITGRIIVDTLIWRREAAKIGLAIGSKVYPASWRTGADAALLREWMHGMDASTEDGKAHGLALAAVRPSPFELIVDGSSHLLLFMRSNESTYLAVVLLGAILFSVPVESTGLPTPGVAWKLDPHSPHAPRETTLDALSSEAAERIVGEAVDDPPGLSQPA
jgi:hypothetical protein